MSTQKQTPIFPLYQEYGAKVIDFGGWDMPVSFSGIMDEHHAVRNDAGLFDVSHMGEIIVEGKDSVAFLQKVMTNDIETLEINKAQYTFMCYENGGTIDDLLIYQLAENKYMLVVNAANIEKDFDWLNAQHKTEDVTIKNQSDVYGLLAIQGPKAEEILQKIVNVNLTEIKPFRFMQDVTINTLENGVLISRTGYTGEDGFEIYLDAKDTVPLWKKLLEIGASDGLLPAGLGARDSLRFEAGLPLYGQELSKDITPVEAKMNFAVKTKKSSDFIGKEVLHKQKENGTDRKLVGLEILDKGIARTDYEVFDANNEAIGFVTTGTKSPTLKKAIAFAYLNVNQSDLDNEVFIQVRKKLLKAKVVKTPFYKR